MDDRTDAQLLSGCREEPERFGVFYDRHVRAVLAFVVRRVGDPEVGADLTAEAFAAALVHAPQFDPARGEAVGWLYGIARNQIRMYERTGTVEMRARRRVGLARVELSDEGIERVERLASLDVRTEVLEDALRELPDEQRRAVVARVVDEHSYERIGTDTGVPAPIARKRVSRGLARLRQRLEDNP